MDAAGGRPSDEAFLGARFSEIPDGVAIVGNVASGKELRDAMGAVPPSDVIIERGAFTLLYRFPRAASRRVEDAMKDLATIVAEGAGSNGLEVRMDDGDGEELLVLRIRRVLHPSEMDLPIVDVLREYAGRLENYVSRALDEDSVRE
ncbi:MAG: hypothetical protein RXP97_02325 [Nitrososphaeria archaeon]